MSDPSTRGVRLSQRSPEAFARGNCVRMCHGPVARITAPVSVCKHAATTELRVQAWLEQHAGHHKLDGMPDTMLFKIASYYQIYRFSFKTFPHISCSPADCRA